MVGDLSTAKKIPEEEQVVCQEPPTVGRTDCIEGFGATQGNWHLCPFMNFVRIAGNSFPLSDSE